jgi:anti-sigma regulatory factor (Ser/Thr protein kinase)
MAPRHLRGFTAAVLACWGVVGRPEYEIREIVSELVSNAIEHSGTADVTLMLGFSSDSVRVCVKDSGRWRQPQADADEIAERGRGLRIVRAYSAQSGIRRGASGTTAWAVIPAELTTRAPTPS